MRTLLLLLWTLYASLLIAQIQAPDASPPGPIATTTGDYCLVCVGGAACAAPPADGATDNRVLPGCTPVAGYDCEVQIKARVYRPMVLTGAYPVIIFLHGNHQTCGHAYDPPPGGTDPPGLVGNPRIDADLATYTGTGLCPAANPLFAPSHLGYDYLADRLASWGYIVVSIDANRGINGLLQNPAGVVGDPRLITARGALVLRHLQQLATWNLIGGTPPSVGVELEGHLDLSNVGLMGHSRGGEGVRAAFALYNPAGSIWRYIIPQTVNIIAVFEIAPTDFGREVAGSPLYSAKGLTWNVLLPMCDGDVSNLAGARPFDRAILPPFSEAPPIQKSTYTVWGANHNFFNTQWQLSDGSNFGAPGYPAICTGAGNTPLFSPSPDSVAQQLVAMSSVLAFFRGNVGAGADVTFNQNFNPPFGIPANVTGVGITDEYPTRTDRGYSPPGSFLVFQDFSAPPPAGTTVDVSNVDTASTSVPNHDSSLRALAITWPSMGAAGSGTYVQTNWTAVNKPGRDITAYRTLDFRVSRVNDPVSNPAGPTDFSIRLVGANGVMTRPLLVSKYTDPNFAGLVGNQSNLTGPVGAVPGGGGLHPILQTVRIPLTDFGNFAFIGPQVRGIRLIFDQTATGSIYVTNFRISKEIGGGAATYPPHALATPTLMTSETVSEPAELASAPRVHTAIMTSIAHVSAAPELNGAPGVRIVVHAADGFPARNASIVLMIGSHAVTTGYDPVIPNEQVFSLTDSEFAKLSPGMPVRVQFGLEPTYEYWDCGRLP